MRLAPLAGIAGTLAAAFLVPATVLCVEALGSLLPPARRARSDGGRSFRMAILVPAHDEATTIEATVRALLGELAPGDRLLVIADNCSDDTAERARAAGAEVAPRRDPERRGKGYALTFGTEVLGRDPPDVVVVMDADCRVERGGLRELAAVALESDRPAQAIYLMRPSAERGLPRVSAFAFLVRNLVRPRGLARLGFPCQLTGTGMAFPWHLFRDAPPTAGFLVEDLLLGHELAILGHPPLLCPEVGVGSELPASDQASLKQRRRWEHGALTVLVQNVPRLLSEGWKQRNIDLVALALDAAVPPLAFLVILGAGTMGVTAVVATVTGSATPLVLALAGGGLITLGLGCAWVAHGRELLTLRDLSTVPGYVVWKIPLYLKFLQSGAHSEWERTDRS